MFQSGLPELIVRKPTTTQLYYAGLIYTPASVEKWGRVQIDTWTYGGPETQQAMLPWHGKDQILIGRDPDNFDAPAVAVDDQGHLICKDIMPVQAGVYDSVNGARDAAKHRRAARTAAAQADAANSYMDDAALNAALAALEAPQPEAPSKPAKVVGARFGGLQPQRQATTPEAAPRRKSYLTPDMMENLDRAIGFKPTLGSPQRRAFASGKQGHLLTSIATHQFGRDGIPARPYLGLTGENREEIEQLAVSGLEGLL